MYRLYFSLLCFILIFSQSKSIKLNSDPKTENAITLNLKLNLKNGDDGYYDGASASKSPQGNYVVLDRGNKSIIIFNALGKIVRQFGKEGNGPGELSNPYRVFTTDKHIYIRQGSNITMFDYNGNYVKDISIMSSGKSGTPLIHQNKLLLYYTEDTADKLVYFDEQGNISRKIANPEYVVPENAGNSRSVSKSSNFSLGSDDTYFYRVNTGSYSVDVLNSDFEIIKHYSKDFNRVVNDYSGVKININGNMTDKERAIRMAAIMNDIKKKYGEYYSDAGSVLGTVGNKIFIQVAEADDNKLTFHVIEDDEFITQYTLKMDGEVNEARIVNGDLMVTYKNDEEGPVVYVYEII